MDNWKVYMQINNQPDDPMRFNETLTGVNWDFVESIIESSGKYLTSIRINLTFIISQTTIIQLSDHKSCLKKI